MTPDALNRLDYYIRNREEDTRHDDIEEYEAELFERALTGGRRRIRVLRGGVGADGVGGRHVHARLRDTLIGPMSTEGMRTTVPIDEPDSTTELICS